MLASFAIVDLAHKACVGERLCKQANAELLSKLGPAVGGVGGGLLGAGVGGGLAKLLQGTPENEEEEATNRRNMILAALAGGGLGAVGGVGAGGSALVQEKLQELGQNTGVQDSLATGGELYGNAVTKAKGLMEQLTGGGVMEGTIPAPPDLGPGEAPDPFRHRDAMNFGRPAGVDANSAAGAALQLGFE